MKRHAILALATLPAVAFAQAAPDGYRDVTVPAGRQPIKLFAPVARPAPARPQPADPVARTAAARTAAAASHDSR